MKKDVIRFSKSLCLLLGIIVLLFSGAVREVAASDETDPADIIANGTCGYNGDNLTWSLDGEGQLTISGSGAMASYNKTSRAPWYSYSSKVRSVVIENGVSSVGAYAFESCRSIERVEMSGDLKNIRDYAFQDCAMLSSVEFGEGLQTIDGTEYKSAWSGKKTIVIKK